MVKDTPLCGMVMNKKRPAFEQGTITGWFPAPATFCAQRVFEEKSDPSLPTQISRLLLVVVIVTVCTDV
jgi:hypothetical protein